MFLRFLYHGDEDGIFIDLYDTWSWVADVSDTMSILRDATFAFETIVEGRKGLIIIVGFIDKHL